MDTKALISLKHVVASYQNEANLYSPSAFKRLLQLAIEGFGDLNIFYTPSFKTSYFTVSSINTVDLPEDFVDYYRVGMIVDGKVWELSRNNNIPIINSLDCGAWAGDADNQTLSTQQYEWHYSFSGGKNVGYYRIDNELRRIVFSGDMMGREVVLEYISTGVSVSGNTWVPREVAEVLKEYIHWKSIQRTDDAVSQKELAQRNYYLALQKYQRRAWSFTLEEFLDAIRSGHKQTVKK